MKVKPYLLLKRFIDIILSLISLVLLSPVFILIILLILFSCKTKGVFFLQERPGKKNKIFKIIKFKTMIDNCDENGNLLPNEQRITQLGSFLRKTSIDELPQLINVLIGNMSIVGPRPLPVRYLELYDSEQIKRHNVKPGITGWAQVNGRNNISWTKKFKYDVYYVNHISLWLDIKIIYLTVFKVIRGSDINAGEDKIGGTGFNGSN